MTELEISNFKAKLDKAWELCDNKGDHKDSISALKWFLAFIMAEDLIEGGTRDLARSIMGGFRIGGYASYSDSEIIELFCELYDAEEGEEVREFQDFYTLTGKEED